MILLHIEQPLVAETRSTGMSVSFVPACRSILKEGLFEQSIRFIWRVSRNKVVPMRRRGFGAPERERDSMGAVGARLRLMLFREKRR